LEVQKYMTNNLILRLFRDIVGYVSRNNLSISMNKESRRNGNSPIKRMEFNTTAVPTMGATAAVITVVTAIAKETEMPMAVATKTIKILLQTAPTRQILPTNELNKFHDIQIIIFDETCQFDH